MDWWLNHDVKSMCNECRYASYYEEGKERLVKQFSDGLNPHNQGRIQRLASVLAALVIGVGSLPFDNVKTKL